MGVAELSTDVHTFESDRAFTRKKNVNRTKKKKNVSPDDTETRSESNETGKSLRLRWLRPPL